MTDISLRNLDIPDLRVAASADGDGSGRDRDAGSQRWDYPNDLESTFEAPRAPSSRASSLRRADTEERQVSR